MSRKLSIAIIGAGLAGLSAALRLKKGCVLFECREKPGGLAETIVDSGFRFDRTGHLLHVSDTFVRKLVMDLIGDEVTEITRRSRIFSNGVYTHYPFQANTYGLPPEIVTSCVKDFVHAYIAREGRRAQAKTFEDFIYANFGKSIAHHFMIPYNEKLWGVHPREITDAWCSRFVPTPSLDEVIYGAINEPRENIGYNSEFLYPKCGIGTLPDAMARRVSSIRYRSVIKTIDYKNKRMFVNGDWVEYQKLISSIPLRKLICLFSNPPKKVTRAAESLRCTGLRYLDVALSRAPGKDYHWSYVPESRYPFYRVGCYSSFSSKMAPAKKGSLYIELSSRGRVVAKALMPRIVAGLKEMGIIRSESDISFVRPRFIEHAYVLYDSSHTKSVETILSWLEEVGIVSIGRYGRWEYAAMEDAILQGRNAAEAVARSL